MRFSRFPAVLAALSLGLGLVACAAAQDDDSNPRFGVWRLRSDNPPPYQNVMTYAPHGEGGMSITVATTNAEGNESVWGYVNDVRWRLPPSRGTREFRNGRRGR